MIIEQQEKECPECGHEVGLGVRVHPEDSLRWKRVCRHCGYPLPDDFFK